MNFAVYLVVYKGSKLPPFYIGSSSLLKINSGYLGSVSSGRYKDMWKSEISNNPDLFKVRIISYHETRQEALEKELILQLKLQVIRNPLYVNLSYAQKNGVFGLSLRGKEHWSKKPGAIHNAKVNHPRGMLGKKHSVETRVKMSKLQSKENNHFYGKQHSEETKKKIKENRPQTKWITDGINTQSIKIEQEIPLGWRRGRTLSKA